MQELQPGLNLAWPVVNVQRKVLGVVDQGQVLQGFWVDVWLSVLPEGEHTGNVQGGGWRERRIRCCAQAKHNISSQHSHSASLMCSPSGRPLPFFHHTDGPLPRLRLLHTHQQSMMPASKRARIDSCPVASRSAHQLCIEMASFIRSRASPPTRSDLIPSSGEQKFSFSCLAPCYLLPGIS